MGLVETTGAVSTRGARLLNERFVREVLIVRP
jgi:hypothetical protein